MIHSTTDLLNELAEITSQSTEGKLDTEPRKISPVSQRLRKEFACRYSCMQSWFLRCSSVKKVKWLTEMLQNLRTTESLSVVLNSLRGICSKSTIYGTCQYNTNFVYDKFLHDHNRSLHKEVLEEVQEADIEWFQSCDDSEQILMLIGLIRLGGGAMVQQVYERGVKLYHQKAEELEHAPECKSLLEIKPVTPRTDVSNLNMQASILKTSNIAVQLPSLDQRVLSITPENISELEIYDPKDPFTIEVENRRKIWNDTINKYRIEVEGKPKKAAKAKGKKKGSAKSSKSGKSGKSKKSKKSSKRGKSSKSGSSKSKKSSKGSKKGKKRGADEAIDQLQLLPIWVVKQIFNYLDAKTLKKAKTVNKYWAYAIADLQKEQKARKNLNKLIKKMKASVQSSEVFLEEKKISKEAVCDIPAPKKRLLKLAERGATLPKLKGKFTQSLSDRYLPLDAARKMPLDSYILRVADLDSFPRSLPRAALLYKRPSCIINELGFSKLCVPESSEGNIVAADDRETKSVATNTSAIANEAGLLEGKTNIKNSPL